MIGTAISGGWAYGLTRLGKVELDETRGARGILDFRRAWSGSNISDYVRTNGAGLAPAKVLPLKVKPRHQLACASRAEGLRESQVQSRIPGRLIESARPLAMIARPRGDWLMAPPDQMTGRCAASRGA